MATTTKQNNQYCTTSPSIDANIGPWSSIAEYLAWLSDTLGVSVPQEGTEILVRVGTGKMTKYRYEVISGTPTWTSADSVAQVVDDELDTASTNPVQNKVVAQAIADLQAAVDSATSSAEDSASSASSASDSASDAASAASSAASSADRSNALASQAASSATSANNSAAAAAQSLLIIQDALANLDPSASTEDAIVTLTGQVAAQGARVTTNEGDIADLKEATADLRPRLDERRLSAIAIGFEGETKSGKVMTLDGNSVVWNTQGNANNVCGTLAVESGDIIYIDPYYNGGYEMLPWCIYDANDNVSQRADAVVAASAQTPSYRVAVTTGGTLCVYMQKNIGIPVIRRVVSEDYEAEKATSAIKEMATFAQTPVAATAIGSVYLHNAALERGVSVDELVSEGNVNNGVYSLAVGRGDIIKIHQASLGGYGNLYWSLINADGIVQHSEGTNNSVADDEVLVAKASGTLYVSYGYYNATTEEHPKPSIYKVADLNARQDAAQNSLKGICRNALLTESSTATSVDSKYIMVEDGVVVVNTAGNTNNGYKALSLTKGDYVKVTNLASSPFSNISWALARPNGSVIDFSGIIGYRTPDEDIELIAPEDSVLYVTFGYYDTVHEVYPKPIMFVLADADTSIKGQGEKIDKIEKTLFVKDVAFDGFDAPMTVRYNGSTTLLRDTTVGNSLNRCYHVEVHKGDRYLVRGASVGGYDGVAWAVFSAGGSVLQQSSPDTSFNTTFEDEIIDIEQDGTLYVNNYMHFDDDLCELLTIDEGEFVGNPTTKPIIVCGDSTSQGLSSMLTASMLDNHRRIYKMGVGSENVYATAARMGAIPCLAMPFTIPAAATAVEISVTPRPLFKQTYDSYGVPLTPAVQNQYVCPMFVQTEHFYCSIGGINGDVYTDPNTNKTYFLRDESGTSLNLIEPTEIVPAKVERVRNSLLVCLMGTNGGYLNYDANYTAENDLRGSQTAEQRAKNLFDVMKRMFAYMGGEMVVIGFFCGELQTYYTREFYEKYERMCEQEFGERFINARLWLKDYCWQKMGLILTATDKQYMAAGYPPVQLFDGGSAIHLSDATNAVFAQYVADRISHLGY